MYSLEFSWSALMIVGDCEQLAGALAAIRANVGVVRLPMCHGRDGCTTGLTTAGYDYCNVVKKTLV